MKQSLMKGQGLKSEGIFYVGSLVLYLYLNLLAFPIKMKWRKYPKYTIQIRISYICIVFDL